MKNKYSYYYIHKYWIKTKKILWTHIGWLPWNLSIRSTTNAGNWCNIAAITLCMNRLVLNVIPGYHMTCFEGETTACFCAKLPKSAHLIENKRNMKKNTIIFDYSLQNAENKIVTSEVFIEFLQIFDSMVQGTWINSERIFFRYNFNDNFVPIFSYGIREKNSQVLFTVGKFRRKNVKTHVTGLKVPLVQL